MCINLLIWMPSFLNCMSENFEIRKAHRHVQGGRFAFKCQPQHFLSLPLAPKTSNGNLEPDLEPRWARTPFLPFWENSDLLPLSQWGWPDAQTALVCTPWQIFPMDQHFILLEGSHEIGYTEQWITGCYKWFRLFNK